MESFKKLPSGKIMSFCMHCNGLSHPFTGSCYVCGGIKEYQISDMYPDHKRTHYKVLKEYQSFVSLSKNDREDVLRILIEYHYKNL